MKSQCRWNIPEPIPISTTVSKCLEKLKADLLTRKGLSKKVRRGGAVISSTQFGNLYEWPVAASSDPLLLPPW